MYTRVTLWGELRSASEKSLRVAPIPTMLTEEEIYEVLRECYDPEIPVNIVDLGLVYGVILDGSTVTVQMTLTAPGCSMGTTTATDIEHTLLGLPHRARATVQL